MYFDNVAPNKGWTKLFSAPISF